MQTEFVPNKRPRLTRVGQTHVEPSIVLSVRPLPLSTSYVDLHDAFSRFGYIAYASCIEGGREGLVEFEDIESAKKCITFSIQNAIGVKGQRVDVNYSVIKRIHRSEMESAQPTNALIITVSNVKKAIDAGVIGKICSPHGEVSRISTVSEVPLKILVHFNSLESANKAKRDLNGVDIYQGCCDIQVEFYSIDSFSISATNQFQTNNVTDKDPYKIGNQTEDHQVQFDTGNLRTGSVSDLNSEIVVPGTGDFCSTPKEFGSRGFSSGRFGNSATKSFNTSAFSHNFSSDTGNEAAQESNRNPDIEGFGNAGFSTQGFANSTQNGFSERSNSREDGSNFRGRSENFGKRRYSGESLSSGGRTPLGFATNASSFRGGINRGRGRRGENSGQFGNGVPSQTSYRNQVGKQNEDHQVQFETGNLRNGRVSDLNSEIVVPDTEDFCSTPKVFGSRGFSSGGCGNTANKSFNTSAFLHNFSLGGGNQPPQESNHNPDFDGFGNAGFSTPGFAISNQSAFSEQSSPLNNGSNFRGRGSDFRKQRYNGGNFNGGRRAPRGFGTNNRNFRGGLSRGRGRRGENFRALSNNTDPTQNSSFADDGFSSTGFRSGGQLSDPDSRSNGGGARGRGYRGFDANGFCEKRGHENRDFNR